MYKSVFLSTVLALTAISAVAQPAPPFTLQKTIELPGVSGKFDHFAVDLTAQRLFAAATGNHSVEVIDLKTGKVEQSIAGLGKPHGVAWIASTHSLFVADGSLANLQRYSGTPLKLDGKLALSEDADDVVYDDKTGTLFVGHGGSADAPARVAVIDAASLQLKTNINVATHPEALEIDNAGQRVFVNVAASNEVAVLNAQGAESILHRWKLSKAADNVPLAFDAEHHLIFVACRTPAMLITLDSDSGKELASIATIGGADDLFYDQALQRVYVIGGSGAVEAFQLDSHRSLHSLGTLTTAPGAKTALFVPSTSQLFVGIPGTGSKPASINVYAVSSARPRP